MSNFAIDLCTFEYSECIFLNQNASFNWLVHFTCIFPDVKTVRLIRNEEDDEEATYINRLDDTLDDFIYNVSIFMVNVNVDYFVLYDDGVLSIHIYDI